MKWFIIIIIMLLCIQTVSAQSLTTSATNSFTSNSDLKTNEDGTKNIIFYHDEHRNIKIGETWYRKEHAPSLDSIYDIRVDLDEDLPFVVNDFNYTSMDVCVLSRNETLVPLTVYHYETPTMLEYMQENEKEVRDCMLLTGNINACVDLTPVEVVDKEYMISLGFIPIVCTVIDVGNIFVNRVRWGSSSTEVIINDSADAGDGELWNSVATSWLDAITNTPSNSGNNASVSTGVEATYTFFIVDSFLARRSYFPINTTTLPDVLEILNASFNIYVDSQIDNLAGDNLMELLTTNQSDANALEKIDFRMNNIQMSEPLNGSNLGWISEEIYPNKMIYINQKGYTKLGLKNSIYDYGNVQPAVTPSIGQRVLINTTESTRVPYLNITYIDRPSSWLLEPINNTINYDSVLFNASILPGEFDVSNVSIHSNYPDLIWGEKDFIETDFIADGSYYNLSVLLSINGDNNYVDGGFTWLLNITSNDTGETISEKMNFSSWELNSTLLNLSIDNSLNLKKAELPNYQEQGWANMSGNILLWHFEKNASVGEYNIKDWSGGRFSTAMLGSPDYNASDKLFGNYIFDGKDDYAGYYVYGGVTEFRLNHDITYMAWIKPKDYEDSTITCFHEAIFGFIWELTCLQIMNDSLTFKSDNFTSPNTHDYQFVDINASDNINLNEWHHVVGTIDISENNISLYLDGELVNSSAPNKKMGHTNLGTFFSIGVRSLDYVSSQWFNGSIDEVSVWNRSLSYDEVNEIYNVQNLSYFKEGLYYSKYFTNNSNVSWDSVEVNTTLNNGNINLSYRTSNNVGCNDGWSSWSTTLETEATCFQYRANFSTAKIFTTPKLNWINISYSVGGVPPEDSCDCPGSGNWIIDCNDNCKITEDCFIPGEYIYLLGSGTFNLEANLTVDGLIKNKNCVLNKRMDKNKIIIN